MHRRGLASSGTVSGCDGSGGVRSAPLAWLRPLLLLLLLSAFDGRLASGYQQNIAQASFDHIGRPGLSAPLQVKCAGGGDRIHILDLYYKINVCRAVEFRQTDAASERNLRLVEQCTGKRVCLVREYDATSPFLDSKPGCLLGGGTQADEMYLLYKCVPPDKVRPICSTFEALDSEGYLATSAYPQPTNASEGKNPCVCDLRAVDASGASSSGRVHLSFAELDLASDRSHVDPTSCQLAEQRQYVQIQYSYGMSSTYELCKHRYNYDVQPSQVFKVIFSNPISRESGKLWMLYKVIGERQDILVKVKCYSLHKYDPTSVLEKISRKVPLQAANEPPSDEDAEEPRKAGLSGLLLPFIIATAVFLVLIIGAAILIISVRHRRRRSRSSTDSKPQKKDGRGNGVPEVCDDEDGRSTADRNGGGKSNAGPSPTAATPSPPLSQSDALAGDCEMDVKSYRPFDTMVYTKLKVRSPDATERTALMGGSPRYVTLPRKPLPSESEDDETSVVDQSLPFVGASRQGGKKDAAARATTPGDDCDGQGLPPRPASR